MWDMKNWTPFGKPLGGHCSGFASIAFSHDRDHIVSSSQHKTVHIEDSQVLTSRSSPAKFPILSTGTTREDTLKFNNSQCSSGLIHPSSQHQLHDVSPFWTTKHGWISCSSSKLLFWLPSQYRTGFWMPL
ncbi:hypothetical protein GGX14DRAFT_453863, partial [Mycena pura]